MLLYNTDVNAGATVDLTGVCLYETLVAAAH